MASPSTMNSSTVSTSVHTAVPHYPSGSAPLGMPSGSPGVDSVRAPAPLVRIHPNPKIGLVDTRPIYAVAVISKLCTNGAKKERIFVIVHGFLMQISLKSIYVDLEIRRNCLLKEIHSVEYDAQTQRACIFMRSDSGKRDWEFFWQPNHELNSHTPHQCLDILDAARRIQVGGEPLPIRYKINRTPSLKLPRGSPKKSDKTSLQDDMKTYRSMSPVMRSSSASPASPSRSVTFGSPVEQMSPVRGSVIPGSLPPSVPGSVPGSVLQSQSREGSVPQVPSFPSSSVFGATDNAEDSESSDEDHGFRVPSALKLYPFSHYLQGPIVPPTKTPEAEFKGYPDSPERPLSPSFKASPERRASSPPRTDSWVNSLF